MRAARFLLYLILALFSLFVSIGIIIDVFYSDNIERSVVKILQENVTSKIDLQEVSFTLWDRFPYASIKFSKMLINDIDTVFSSDTLLYAEEAYVSFNLIDVIQKKYIINRVYIDGGNINIRYNKEEKPNFLIFKKDTSNRKKLIINDLILNESNVKYIRSSNNTNIDWDVSESITEFIEGDIVVSASIHSNTLFVYKTEYLKNKDCSFKTVMSINEDTLLIGESEIFIEDFNALISGFIVNNDLNLTVQSENQKLSSVINHMPNKFKEAWQAFIIEGLISCDAEIKGVASSNKNPSFNMDFNISDGNFELKEVPFTLNSINTFGKITNGNLNNFETTSLTFSEFRSKTGKGFLNGDFTVTNLNKYFLSAQIESSWDLSELNKYFQDSPFLDLQGEVGLLANYQGNISFNRKFKDYFLESEHAFQTSLRNITFKHINSPLEFDIISAKLNVNNNIINVNSSSLNVSQSSFNFSGEVKEFFRYLLKRTDQFYIQGDMIASTMLFSELMLISSNSLKVTQNTLPDWLELDLNIDVSNFIYNDFNASRLVGKIQYRENKLSGIELVANSLEGYIHSNFILTEPTKNYLVLKSDLEIDKINIRKSFGSFNNFNQQFITQNHINGIASADLDIEAHWKPSFVFNDSKLKVKSHMIIEEGELIDFAPLESLSSFVSIEDLKHVKFSTLENTIEIENKVITVPAMEIKSSALSVFLSGTHTFAQEIDYRIKLLLSELLSNTFRKSNTALDNEFGELDDEGRIFNTVYLKMTGNTEDPKISFDGLKIKEDIQEGINTEIETIKTIINEDILNTEEFLEDEEGQDIIIEWEEEQSNPK